jgi:iron-sulfur cluster repair protein YtfE (RIC family)
MNVLTHLVKEHREVEAMLEKLADSEPGSERQSVLDQLTESLSTHMLVEEQFVYPIVKEVVGSEDEQEAENEHQLARDGLMKLQEFVSEPGFGAAVDMVKAGIKHHVEEEESEIFPELREKASDRIEALGEPDELEAQVKSESSTLSRAELYAEAREAGIAGRSKMSKSELEGALNK